MKRAPRAAARPILGPKNSKNAGRRWAALDIGTHAAKLLVMSVAWEGEAVRWRSLFRAGIVTRLGEGAGGIGRQPGSISAAAEARAAEALRELVERARELAADTWVAAGTGVLRRAANGQAVARRLGLAIDTDVPVLDPETEAALSLLGARAGTGPTPPLLGIDLGGGSTELIFLGTKPAGESGQPAFEVRSLDLGCLSLAERYLTMPEGGPDALRRGLAQAIPGPLLRPGIEAPRWIALGGTSTALATMDLGLSAHDPTVVHGHRLTAGAIARLAKKLHAAAPDTIPPFHRQPAPVLLAGAYLLRHLMAMHAVREVVTSTFGLRHGLILGKLLAERRGRPDPRRFRRSAIELARDPLPRLRIGRSEGKEIEGAKRVDPSVHPQ